MQPLMELYFTHTSGNSGRCVFTLLESGIDWKQHRLDPHSGETRTAEYRAVNPMGKVPTLVHDKLVLWESNAINWFIAQKHPEAQLLPKSIEAQAAVQQWMFFQGAHQDIRHLASRVARSLHNFRELCKLFRTPRNVRLHDKVWLP